MYGSYRAGICAIPSGTTVRGGLNLSNESASQPYEEEKSRTDENVKFNENVGYTYN